MNKIVLISLSTATLLSTVANASTMDDRFDAMQKEIESLKAEVKQLKSQETISTQKSATPVIVQTSADQNKTNAEVKQKLANVQNSINTLNKRTGNNHLKFNVDFRTAVDNMQYKMANGTTQGNDALLTNRLWLGMNWAATDHISFTAQLAYDKAYGARSGLKGQNTQYENFDWITNENAYDNTLRVRSAYFFYKNNTFAGTNIPWTFSLGRRPSTNGHLVNLRDDDQAASPMGHAINVEFDGLSSKFDLQKTTGVNGMYVKFCAGRGGSNALPRFNNQGTPYASNPSDVNNMDLAGLIFVPYDNGQYSVGSEFYYANNLIDAKSPTDSDFKNVGGLYSATANFMINGIGDWNEFLDNTIFFVSGAVSQTNPNSTEGMLGSPDAKTGYSEWVGLQFPSLISEDGKWGIEYNHGSKYWRSLTYGEDTNVGSKLAVRGNAYEAYFTEPIVSNVLSLQIRYTYMDYDYTGSNGFFGDTTGTPYKISDITDQTVAANAVKSAQDIRFYLRYKY